MKRRYVVTLVVEADVFNPEGRDNSQELYRVHEMVRTNLSAKMWNIGRTDCGLISLKVEGRQFTPSELSDLYKQWKDDPIYDLYDAPEYQAHRYELMSMQYEYAYKNAKSRVEQVEQAFQLLRDARIL